MKKRMISAILLCLLAAGTAGCTGAGGAGDAAAMQSQIDQLQQELDSLSPDSPAPQSEKTQETPKESNIPPEAPDSAAHTMTVDSYEMADLEAAVEAIVSEAAAASATGNPQDDRDAFQKLHNSLEEVEGQVERMENAIEADVRSGALSREDYRVLDSQLDDLEDRLDRAEDQLEFTFGMDL